MAIPRETAAGRGELTNVRPGHKPTLFVSYFLFCRPMYWSPATRFCRCENRVGSIIKAPGRLGDYIASRLLPQRREASRNPMTGRSRLPAGEPRKASQRRTRPAVGGHAPIMPQWRMGDRVRWQDKMGHFHRDLGDGNAEVTIANRAYRVRIGDLRAG